MWGQSVGACVLEPPWTGANLTPPEPRHKTLKQHGSRYGEWVFVMELHVKEKNT